jgi:hypothetical protein
MRDPQEGVVCTVFRRIIAEVSQQAAITIKSTPSKSSSHPKIHNLLQNFHQTPIKKKLIESHSSPVQILTSFQKHRNNLFIQKFISQFDQKANRKS